MAFAAFARDVERDQVGAALRRATVLLAAGPGPCPGAIPPLCRPAERRAALTLLRPLHALPSHAVLRRERTGRPSPRNKGGMPLGQGPSPAGRGTFAETAAPCPRAARTKNAAHKHGHH